MEFPKRGKRPSESVLEPLNIELLNAEGIEQSEAIERWNVWNDWNRHQYSFQVFLFAMILFNPVQY